MKNQITWVDITVTNLDRAITGYSAFPGEPVKKQKQSAQDFVPDFPLADTHLV